MTFIPADPSVNDGDDAAYAFSLFRFQGDEDSGSVAFRRLIEVLEPLNGARIQLSLPCDRVLIEKITTLCRENCGWSASHIAAALSWMEVFQTPVIASLVNARDPISGTTPLRIAINGGDLRLLNCLLSLPTLDLADIDEQKNTVIHLAAKEGPTDLLSSLLPRATRQTDINAMNEMGNTALHSACQKPARDSIELLLDAGADPLIGANELPLQLVVSKDAMDCVELIFDRYPETLNCPQPSDFSYPLHLASNSTMFRRLCEFGANLDAQDASGITALHMKVRENDLDAVMYLLARGANPNLTDSEGSTPLHYAITFDASVHIIRALLVFEADCCAVDKRQQSARHLLCTGSTEYQHSEAKDLALYTLHALGAERCSPTMKECTAGCIAMEVAAQEKLVLFDGTAPEVTHNPSDDAANLFEEIFSCANLQQYQPMYNSQRRPSRRSLTFRRTSKIMRSATECDMDFRSASPLSDSNLSTLEEDHLPALPVKLSRRRSYQEVSVTDSSASCRFTLGPDLDEQRAGQRNPEPLPCKEQPPKPIPRPSTKSPQVHASSSCCTCDKDYLKRLRESGRNHSSDPSASSPDVNQKPAPSPTASQTPTHSDGETNSLAQPVIARPLHTLNEEAPVTSLDMTTNSPANVNDGPNEGGKSKPGWNCGPCGYRLLSLDGGGIRGLILVQILRALERTAGKPVTELFDWMIGTSTGGILSLLILRGKCLRCCRNLLFTFKDTVFYGKRPYPAEGLEGIIRREFGEETKMTDLKHIRVAITTLVSDRCPPVFHMFRNYTSPRLRLHELLKTRQQAFTVNNSHNRKKTSNMSPRFRQNSSLTNSSSVFDFLWNASGFRAGGDTSAQPFTLGNETEEHFSPISQDSEQLVWMAARATGAAPTYFRPCGRFLDGGLISNNPTLDLLTELQEMHLVQQMEDKPVTPIAVVVSLGTGRMPVEPLETVDVFRPQSLMETFRSAMGFSSLGRIVVEMATMSEGPVVDRASAWCASLGVPYFRFSPRISLHVSLDTTDIKELLQMVWETEAYLHRARDRIEDLAYMLL